MLHSRLNSKYLKSIALAQSTQVQVLITGETGTGKSWLAKLIHDSSERANKPFHTLNLASLPEGTLESELFGHERGSFTGADSKRQGRLEQAHGGTLFLDEIAELPLRLQSRLLEFLQRRCITPIGSNREIQLDVRIISATHKNLSKCSREGTFRSDLFHRLRVLEVRLPSLRERPQDFNEIVQSLLSELALSCKKKVYKLSEETALRLENYSWPGNLRELRNVLECAVLSAASTTVELHDIPEWFAEEEAHFGARQSQSALLGTVELPIFLNFNESLRAFHKSYYARVLERHEGKINETARNIGLNKTTFIRKLRAAGYDQKRSNFSAPAADKSLSVQNK